LRCASPLSSPVRLLIVGARRGKLFKPFADVFDEAALEVVDVDGRGDVHGGDKTQAVPDAAARDDLLYLVGDVHHFARTACFKNQILRVTFHDGSLDRPEGEVVAILSPLS